MTTRFIARFTILTVLASYVLSEESVVDAESSEEETQSNDITEEVTEAFFKRFDDGENAYLILKLFELMGPKGSSVIQLKTNKEEEPNQLVSAVVDRYTELKKRGVFDTIKKKLGLENEPYSEYIAKIESQIEEREANIAKFTAILTEGTAAVTDMKAKLLDIQLPELSSLVDDREVLTAYVEKMEKFLKRSNARIEEANLDTVIMRATRRTVKLLAAAETAMGAE